MLEKLPARLCDGGVLCRIGVDAGNVVRVLFLRWGEDAVMVMVELGVVVGGWWRLCCGRL